MFEKLTKLPVEFEKEMQSDVEV